MLDSTDLAHVTTREYEERTAAYVSHFGTEFDVYEIGNELNGEWAGQPAELNAKVLTPIEWCDATTLACVPRSP